MDDFTDAVALTAREVSTGVVVVAVAGELDMATVPEVEQYVRDRLGDASRVLVLDLSGVTFLGSTGINLLIALRAACDEAGVALRLVATTKAVLHPLELTDLTDHFTIVTAVSEAG
ncbi:STAS domain-containing protein [Saccharothrix sp. 6-C]|uniref:Anti-sigma factor antagonist n=1 Tax=Saccharothrix texasensis TaxID=103734 RepID=A0A3N1H2F8_9PSEU|nr:MULTISPECIES: STAS domain-containing protein [Saccharothrix]QQQ78602.1 STAS domain-containing protein [Saccharothrix sp. 6-C]ROP36713.1 anti-sigma B factor antagonist [Saccharothrix texasensis]